MSRKPVRLGQPLWDECCRGSALDWGLPRAEVMGEMRIPAAIVVPLVLLCAGYAWWRLFGPKAPLSDWSRAWLAIVVIVSLIVVSVMSSFVASRWALDRDTARWEADNGDRCVYCGAAVPVEHSHCPKCGKIC